MHQIAHTTPPTLNQEATIAFDIGTEDGSELAFDTLRCHGITPPEVLVEGEN
jgi:hypothetical protein